MVALARSVADRYNLRRFVTAQTPDYRRAIMEIKRGCKRTCWMWYVFPRLIGDGYSRTSEFYALRSLAEARAYLRHPLLRRRLEDAVVAVLDALDYYTVVEIFGQVDALKLVECAEVFARVTGKRSVYQRLLERLGKE